jgi:CRISPR-associated protein Csb1
LIDSVGSQANRMEPIFKEPPYSALVPQVKIRMKKGDEVNLLDLGHRAADAAIRFSTKFGPALWDAFNKFNRERDCSDILKIAPTSLVFGVWDSRATGAKIPRIVRSVIRAYGVVEGKRSATYRAAYDYTTNGMISPDRDKGSGKNNPLSQEGFKYSLATATHGGVLTSGDILQEGVINLVALRTLSSDLNSKRYLLGLALVALSHRDQRSFNLREGCLLVAASKEDADGSWKSLDFDGTEDIKTLKNLKHSWALEFAQATVTAAKITNPIADAFDSATAEGWLSIEKKKRKTLAKTKHPIKALEEEKAAAAKKKTKAEVSAGGGTPE